ncbi:MAG TPA: tRNA pseudouridine(55) synthase TruB [Rhodanobacteraceae bacterium]|nr:tRNA pseudouridine(55) synthase TruB [Rhodanobacteraceae bacterium]
MPQAESRIPPPESRPVNGIVLLDKPTGMSSNRALQQAKRLFAARKAGHTGSLDPLATGMLPLCFGEATKIAGLLLGSGKAYRATLRLGVTTDSDDADGAVLRERPVPTLSVAQIEAEMAAFHGAITQTPPAISAIKQAGVPLYRRVRRGEAVVVPSRVVQVHRFALLRHDGDHLELEVECGSGTYVRSLARDLGERLGCGAHLTALRRLWVAPFRDAAMVTLDTLVDWQAHDPAALAACVLPLNAGLASLPVLTLDEGSAQRLRQGQRLCVPGAALVARCRALDPAGQLIALVEVGEGGGVRILRGFNSPPAT